MITKSKEESTSTKQAITCVAKGIYRDNRTKNYSIRIKVYGRQFKKVIGLDLRKAEIALAEKKLEIKISKLAGQGWSGFTQLQKATKPRTFADAITDYMEERANGKASSIRSYENIFNQHLLPEFGSQPLADIGDSLVKKFQVKLGKQNARKRVLSPRRINNIMQLLGSVLEQEYVRGHIQRNTSKSVKKVQEEKAEIDPFSAEELESALSHLDPHYLQFFTVYAFTGARPNELAALRWKDIDFKDGTISISRGLVRGHEGLPKTKSGQRKVPMTPPVVEALRRLSENQTVVSQQGYVFTNKKGQPLGEKLDRIWARALKKAKIRHRASYHLRHTFVTRCIIEGLPLPYIAKIIGHSTIDTLIRHYAGWIESSTQACDEKLRLAFTGVGRPSKVAQ